MRYTTEVEVVESVKTPDGMGGYTATPTTTGYITAHMSPVKVELMLKQYGLATTSAFRLVTQDELPRQVLYFRIGSDKYKMLEMLEYSKYNIILIEVVK